MTTRVLTAVLAFVAAASISFAHHNIQGQFNMSKSVTLKGTISKVDWINPHVYVRVDVKRSDGTVEAWELSTIPLAMMRKAGLTREALTGKRGEVVTIAAAPAKDSRKRIGWISRITYSDGHYYQLF
jgi:hypothetical protein